MVKIESILVNMGYMIIYPNGDKCWYGDGRTGDDFYHSIGKDGFETWWLRSNVNLQHNLEGPAILNPNNDLKKWFYYGKEVNCSSQKDFERYLRLLAFI